MAAPTITQSDAAQGEAQDEYERPAVGHNVGQMATLPDLPQKERAHRQRIADTWKAYKGDWGAGPLRVAPGDPDDNVRPNRCMPIVDTGISCLFGEVVKIAIANSTDATTGKQLAVDNGAAQGTSPAQAYLDECWGDDDDKMTLLSELAMNGAIAGSSFAMLVPANKQAGQDCPRIVVLDPQNVTVIADPHDCRTVQEYWIQYEVDTYDYAGKPLHTVYRKVICHDKTADGGSSDAWLILDYKQSNIQVVGGVSASGQGVWICTGRTEWPKPWPPIVDCQNLPNPNEYWGIPDLPDDLVQLNRALIFNESNIARIIKHHAHPTRWATGIGLNEQIRSTPDNILLFQSEKATLNALPANADLANAMAFSQSLRLNMDEQSQIPSIALGRMSEVPRGQLSGVTIRALYEPIMQKTTKKRRLYGKLIRLLSQHMLELGNFGEAAKARITLHWGDPLPNDDLSAAQAAQIWNQVGVSSDTLLQRNGFDPDIEAMQKQQEQQRQVTAFSQGQGMPPMPPQAMMAGGQVPGESEQSQQGGNGNENAPPVNHPAAIRQRAVMRAASQAAKTSAP